MEKYTATRQSCYSNSFPSSSFMKVRWRLYSRRRSFKYSSNPFLRPNRRIDWRTSRSNPKASLQTWLSVRESGSGENAISGLFSIASVRFRRTERNCDRSSRAGGESGVHGRAFQPFGGEVRRTVEEARDRDPYRHAFIPVLQARAALQRPRPRNGSVEGWHRISVLGRGAGRKTRGCRVLRREGPGRLRAGRVFPALPRWYK